MVSSMNLFVRDSRGILHVLLSCLTRKLTMLVDYLRRKSKS